MVSGSNVSLVLSLYSLESVRDVYLVDEVYYPIDSMCWYSR